VPTVTITLVDKPEGGILVQMVSDPDFLDTTVKDDFAITEAQTWGLRMVKFCEQERDAVRSGLRDL